MWNKLRGQSSGSKNSAKRRPRTRGWMPFLETLESRRLLATVSWISSTSGSWDTASNWSTGTVPGPDDDAVINVPGVTATIGPNVESVHSITADDPLVISGGGLTVAANSTIGGGLSMTGGSLKASGSGVTLMVTGATALSGASIYSEGGATLNVPSTSYAGGNGYADSFQATGTGSVLSLPKLASITSNTNFGSLTQVQALAGGEVELPALTQISGGPVHLESDGSASRLNVSALSSFQGQSTINYSSLIQDTNGGTVLDGSLTSLSGVNLTLDGTGTIATALIASYTCGTLTLGGGTAIFTSLTNADGSSFLISGGASLALPGVTSVSNVSFTLSGAGAIEANDITTLGGTLNVNGGTLSLPGVTSADNAAINVSGAATLRLPAPTAFTAMASTVTVSGAGSSIHIGSGILNPLPTSGTGLSITVPPFPQGMILNLIPSVTFSGETTFNVGAGATVNIGGGTYTGGVTLNVARAATVDLTDGQTVTYSGTLTGSGSGTVQLSSGILAIGIGGATFDFPGSMFQWTGGAVSGACGAMTNQGTMNLAGPNEKQIYADGTLDNFGTIIQTGAGNFGLHSDNELPTTLNNEPGAYYLIESDAGVNNEGLGDNMINNQGTIRKAAGTETSTLYVPQQGSLSNTGTIEAESGTIYLEATTIDQLSLGTLSAGTWNARDGSTLAFPSGKAITNNQANITLDGQVATIAALSGLTSNSGVLSLTDGSGFSTAGNFSNTGSLTLGAGSTLNVHGNYTQGADATMALDIGGSATSGQFGQLAITGTAALAGTVNTTFINGYSPTAGDNYPITTYASETGGSSLTFTGLSGGAFSFIQPVVNATAIDLTSTTGAADLSVEPFSVAANGTVGQDVTIAYHVQNLSSNAASGDWYDSFFLSTTTGLNSSSLLLGTVQHTGGLAADASYGGSLTAALPGVVPEQYYLIAEIDSEGLVPDVNRANNVAASSNPINVALTSATLGQTVPGTIDNGQDVYYQITVPAGQDLAIDASFAALQGGELYVGYQRVPTSSSYIASSTSATQLTQQVVIPDTQVGTYFILLQGDTGSTGGKPFTLSTKSLPLQVTGVSPASAGNSGTTTLTIQGAEFTSGTSVKLVPHGGGTSIAASAVTFQGSTTLFAQFTLAGAAAGNYDVMVSDGAQKATEPSAFSRHAKREPRPHRVQPECAVDLAPWPHRLPDAHKQQRRRCKRSLAAVRRLGHQQ
jgi:hypothetical protein